MGEPTQSVFPLLADLAGYRACTIDLASDQRKRAYWLGVFRRHFPTLLEHARLEAASRQQDAGRVAHACELANEQFMGYLDHIEKYPQELRRLDVLTICLAREEALRAAGIEDAYRLAKQKENQVALGLLPDLLAEQDAMDESHRLVRLIQGVFAGNMFDLGATKTSEMFRAGQPVDFHDFLAKLKPRPWAVDDLDAFGRRVLEGPAYRRAVVLVDNAGPDVILGMIPLVREFLRRGTQMIVAANSHPSLNDVTYDELVGLVQQMVQWDAPLRRYVQSGMLTLVPSGNGAPLIDLTRVSPELAALADPLVTDLVILEGMGRAIESNWSARFVCDAVKIAMIKDPGAGETIGCQMFDLVLRYEPACGHAASRQA